MQDRLNWDPKGPPGAKFDFTVIFRGKRRDFVVEKIDGMTWPFASVEKGDCRSELASAADKKFDKYKAEILKKLQTEKIDLQQKKTNLQQGYKQDLNKVRQAQKTQEHYTLAIDAKNSKIETLRNIVSQAFQEVGSLENLDQHHLDWL